LVAEMADYAFGSNPPYALKIFNAISNVAALHQIAPVMMGFAARSTHPTRYR
jgi:hypothetical protein